MMKRRFLYVSMLSTCCMSALAQTSQSAYRLFAQDGKEWETQVGFIMENVYGNYIDGDTVINGESWKKVYNYMGIPELNYSYYAAIRDIEKKVYVIAKGSSRPRLLYDFGLQVGDLVRCGIEGNAVACLLEPGEKPDTLLGFPLRTYLKVERIDTIEARNNLHRRFTLSLLDAYKEYYRNDDDIITGNVVWIEGVGSGAGPFAPWMPLPPKNAIILNCTINGTYIFGNHVLYKDLGNNSIKSIQSYHDAESVYDLQGRRLQKAPEKGLYIQDGKIKKQP